MKTSKSKVQSPKSKVVPDPLCIVGLRRSELRTLRDLAHAGMGARQVASDFKFLLRFNATVEAAK